MKPSSPEPQTVSVSEQDPEAPAAGGLPGGSGTAVIRPARLDRPLSGRLLEPGYADAHLEAMLAEAAERAREAARAQGYAAGWAHGAQAAAAAQQAGREQAEAERRAAAARAETLLAALAEAARRHQQAGLPAWHEVADALADGALALARAALGRELRAIDEPVADAVRTALRRLAAPGEVSVHLNPEDAALLATADLPPTVRLVADASVPAGAVRAQTPTQRLLLHLPAALAAAEEVLRS